MKRKNECLFCTSRKCYDRIVTKGGTYDEVACRKHSNGLYDHAGLTAPGVLKRFISSTGPLSRGDDQ